MYPGNQRGASTAMQQARLTTVPGDGFLQPATLVDALYHRTAAAPDAPAYRFLQDGAEPVSESPCQIWTNSELEQHSGLLARRLLHGMALAGMPATGNVLIVCPAGLEFVSAFFACLRAGLTAAPLQPPGRKQEAARWQHIVRDASPVAVLTVSRLRETVDELMLLGMEKAPSRAVPVIEIDVIEELPHAALSALPLPDPSSVALLQYTSGSTRLPRGVQVSHANLVYNLEQIRCRFGHTADSHGVIWLPPHHDMGLIGGILQPVYAGFPVTLMSPAAFLRRPARWLQAISHFGATTSGGPNFAYEYCLRRCSEKDLAGLDLSRWQVAFNGAETVRSSTIKRFSDKFAICGFNRSAFLPCYGLAEATLLVTSAQCGGEPHLELALDGEALRRNIASPVEANEKGARILSSSGVPAADTQVCIVEPKSGAPLDAGVIGEIWVSGPGVAKGYQHQDEESAATFRARVNAGAGHWLRTGDLGFLHNGQLFVTGRLRDLIIIRGANHAPQDIELSVETSHPRFLPSATAAFTVEDSDGEALVIMQELERGPWTLAEANAAMDAIRAAVSRDHGLQVRAIVLVKPTSLPKTPSGKVQRQRCRTAFVEDALIVAFEWRMAVPSDEKSSVQETQKVDALLQWLRDYAETSIRSRLMDERRSLSPGVLLDFGNQGLLGMQVPTEFGGLGLGYQSTHRVIEQLAAIDPTLALFVGLNNVLGIRPILQFGTEQQKAYWLPRLASGRELVAFALTEPGAGSNPNAMQASAVPDGRGGWIVNGTKVWSGSAAWAGLIHIFVRQCDEQGRVTGISAFAVPKGRRGLRHGPEALTMGMRAMVQNTVLMNNLALEESDRLGEPHQGMAIAQDAMNNGRLVIAAACVGGMKRCAQLMLRYAQRRRISTGVLLENPLLQTRLESICSSIDALSVLVQWMSVRLDRQDTVTEEVYAVCKILAPELYWQAADWLMQCLGGRGYIESNPAAQIFRDARVLRIFEGPTETLSHYLGARVLRQPSLLSLLRHDLRAENEAFQLESAVEPLSKQAQSQGACLPPLGELASWLLLSAVLKSSGAEQREDSVNTLEWLQVRCMDAKQRFAQQLKASAGGSNQRREEQAARIANRIQAFRKSIGDVEQQLAEEERELDSWLRRDGSAPVALSRAERSCAELSGAELVVSQSVETSAPSTLNQPAQDVQRWLVDWLAQRLSLNRADIDARRAFADLGVDSVLAVELGQDLETAFALPQSLDPTLAWSYPTIEALAALVTELTRANLETNAIEVTTASPEDTTDWMQALQAELTAGTS